MFYSISAQRWYRIELEVLTIVFLIIVFSDKVLHVVLLEGTKENNCDSERKKTITWESVFSLKNGLKRKVLMDVDPRKEDRAIRDGFLRNTSCVLSIKKISLWVHLKLW